MVEEDKGKASSSVKDASLTQTYSFLPAFWAGDTHKETDFLPIGDQEEKGKRFLDHCTDSSRGDASTYGEVLADRSLEARDLDC